MLVKISKIANIGHIYLKFQKSRAYFKNNIKYLQELEFYICDS